MRLISTLGILLLFSYSAGAQRLTGIWRGYFSSSSNMLKDDPREEVYKYEVQVEQLPNNGVKGVTYSYKTTVFYAKTGLQGIFTVQSKSLIIKETNIMELKIGEGSAPCLMTCYLDYSKLGKLEVLQGTFISVSTKNKSDCGSGKVYLEKVPTSDFVKEDFLLKKKPAQQSEKKTTVKPRLAEKAPAKKPPVTSRQATPQAATAPPGSKKRSIVIPKTKAPAPKETIPAPIKPLERADNAIAHSWGIDTTIRQPKEMPAFKTPVPRVLLERENKLVQTLYCDEGYIQIDLYDNGTIDNDTISLYHNNKQVVNNGRLSYTPITYRVKCNALENHHEFVIVAENLGEIPPNTALMVVTMGKSQKRYEIFLTSNENRNAKVIIEYRPQH